MIPRVARSGFGELAPLRDLVQGALTFVSPVCPPAATKARGRAMTQTCPAVCMPGTNCVPGSSSRFRRPPPVPARSSAGDALGARDV
jgi:hypothetical protein